MFKTLIGAAAVTVVVAGSAQAALNAYEGFNYAASSLAGKGLPADPGFATSWTQSGANGGNVVPAGLSYANLLTAGGALDLAGPGTTLNFRGLNNIYDNPSDSSTGEIWWSYLIRPGAYTGIPFAGLSFYSDALSGSAATDTDLATATRDSNGLKYGFSDLDLTTNFVTASVAPTNGVTALIVGRVILGGGDNTNANNEDRIHLYVNPTIGGATPPSDANANVTVNFQTIRFAAQNGAPFIIDEFRLGESFADVTPVTPPNTDFDGGGTGLSDFHVLRMNYLTGTLHSEGDANSDGTVNHVDFFLWRTAFAAAGGNLEGVSLPIPEPSSAVAIVVLGCVARALGLARRRRT